MQWSYSRRTLLERCPRAYYYHYYGANKRTAKAESLKERLHFLKSLTNRHLRTGDIVHLVIRTYLNNLQRKNNWDVRQVLSWAHQIFQKDYTYSSTYQPNTERSNDRYPPVLLSEFYHDLEDADRLFYESESRMLAVLENFVSNPAFVNFRNGACHPDALIERRISIKNDRFSMRGKFDLAYPDGARTTVVDWKIGKSEGNDDSL